MRTLKEEDVFKLSRNQLSVEPIADCTTGEPPSSAPASFLALVSDMLLDPSVKILDGYIELWSASSGGKPAVQVHIDSWSIGLMNNAFVGEVAVRWSPTVCEVEENKFVS